MNVGVRPEFAAVNAISICTGGGGLDLGVELAIPSARIVCMVEREAFAIARLVSAMEAGLMAPAPVWSDVRTFRSRRWRGLVDGVFGGIPCQPHSEAGLRLGEEDERDLWSPTRRIIVASGAWWVLLENVSGMLSSGGAERVRRDLLRMGFHVEGGLFTAAEVGASHERARLFILGVADGNRFRQQGVGELDSWTQPASESSSRRGYADRCDPRLADAQRDRWGEGCGPLQSGTDQSRPSAGDQTMGDAEGARSRPGSRQDRSLEHRAGAAGSSDPLVHAQRSERWPDARREHKPDRGGAWRGEAASRPGEPDEDLGLFPPGPSAGAAWCAALSHAPHLEPAVRRVADGMAFRVDELRLLGNGVVPLQAAYAIRTLATRLARRSAGAAFLVERMT